MKNFLLLLIGLMFLAFPVSASFSDNLDTDLNKWNPVVGSVISTQYSWDGSGYLRDTGANAIIYAVNGGTGNYYTFMTADFQTSDSGTCSCWSTVWFRTDATNSNGEGIKFDATGTSMSISSVSVGSGAGFSFSSFTIGAPLYSTWVKTTITDLGNTLSISFYNYTLLPDTTHNNSLIKTIVIADVDVPQATTLALQGYSVSDSGFDDITISSVSPSSSNSVTWDSGTHYSGDFGYYDYIITDAEWGCATCSLYQIRANVYKGDTEMESVALSSQTGRIYYQFGSSGTDLGGYTVKLISYFDGYYNLGFSGTELASGNTSLRSIGDSRIAIPSTIPTGVYTNASVIFGFTPSNTFVDGIVLFSIDENGNEIKESTSSIYTHLPITVGTPFNISVIPRKEGKYILKLYDFAKGYVTSAATTSNFQIPVPTLNITTSFIKTDLSSYAYGEVLTANYGIDNSNFSNYKVVLDLYNYDYGISTLFQPLVYQSTDFYGTVFGFSSNPGVCDFSTKECQIFGLAGNNTLRLLATNATASVIIINANFTISNTNAEGYGLKPSKTEGCTNEKVFFLAYSPLPSNFTITNTKGTVLYSVLINQTKTISYSFKDMGEYSVNLYKTNSNENVAFVYMKIKSCGTPTPTSTTTTAAQTTALVDLLSSNLFWALIFTVGMMTMIAFATMKR